MFLDYFNVLYNFFLKYHFNIFFLLKKNILRYFELKNKYNVKPQLFDTCSPFIAKERIILRESLKHGSETFSSNFCLWCALKDLWILFSLVLFIPCTSKYAQLWDPIHRFINVKVQRLRSITNPMEIVKRLFVYLRKYAHTKPICRFLTRSSGYGRWWLLLHLLLDLFIWKSYIDPMSFFSKLGIYPRNGARRI
jgi:hypothetical protein